jgi:histidyl-tRNA synthetase
LRYEFTFQLARIFKQHPTIKLPFRRYQIGENFRDEPVGPGRFRQFTQCDADVIGDTSVDSEAELLSMTRDILKALGIEAEIFVNNRKLVSALIESVQIRDARQVMRELDKLGKISEDLVKSNLRKYGDTNQILTLFKLLEKDLAFFVENGFDGAAEVEELVKKCRRFGVSIVLQPTMMRGLSYYTGNIYEVCKQGEKSSIAGGGRYDGVVGKYLGREVPAFGISFGLERVTALASLPVPPPAQALVVSLNKDVPAIKLLQELRAAKVSCIMMSGKISKGLEYANTVGIPYAIFVGDDEIAKKKWKIRNMNSGEEKYTSTEKLIKILCSPPAQPTS